MYKPATIKMKKLFIYLFSNIYCLTLVASNPEWHTFDMTNSGLPNPNIHDIVIVDGKKFISSSGGLSIYNDTVWTNYTIADGLPSNWVNAVATQGNTIWIGTFTSGAAYFDGSTWTTYNSSNSGLPVNTVYDIQIDQNGVVWFATPNGMASYDGVTWNIYNTSTSFFPSPTVYSLAVESPSEIWLGAGSSGSFQGAISLLTPPTVSGTYRTTHGMVSNEVNTILLDSAGGLWVGTYYGLSYFDGNNFTNYTTSSGLSDDYVKCLATDSSGNLWVGTNNGLSFFDGSNWTVYNTSNSGLPNNSVKTINVDENDNVWLGTTSGVTLFKPGGIVLSNPLGDATINGGGTICEGDSVSLKVDIQGGLSPYYVELSGGKIISNYKNGDVIWISPSSTGSYTLQTVTDGFSNTPTNLLGTAGVTVNTNPTVTLDDFANAIICTNAMPEQLPQGMPSGGVYTGIAVSGSNFDPAVSGAGNFYVSYTFTDANNCVNSDSSSIQVDVCTSSQTTSERNDFNIYPNPVNGQYIYITHADHFGVTIYDQQGKLIFKDSAEVNMKIDTHNLATGLYVFVLSGSEGFATRKVLIE